MLPASARRNHQRQAALTAVVVASVRRAWRRMRPTGSWSEQWSTDVGPKATALVVAGQSALASESESYIATVLDELGIPSGSPTRLNLPNFVAVAGDGRPVSTLLDQAVVRAGQTFTRTQDAAEALESGQAFLDRVTASLLADAARAAESVAIAQRPWVDGFVRMLNLPSCSRCTILAGRFYLWNDGFERHPMCDCRHIPAMEEGERFGSLVTNPNTYFDSLSREEQDRIFTKAGAEAIRDGADISQVVNARRGMTRAQVYGHDVLVTDEGTTRRGVAYRRMGGDRSTDTRRKGERYFRTRTVRLMPEAIYEIATGDRTEAIRLLKLYGFIT